MTPGDGMAVEVGPAREEEFTALATLLVAAYRSVDPPVREEYVPVLGDIAGRAADSHRLVLCARLHGRAVGCATVVTGGGELPEDAVQLRMLGVDPSARGHGAGRALVLATIAVARRLGRHRVMLDTQAHMLAAQSIYRSLGFVRHPERDRMVPDTDVFLLAHELILEG